MEEQTVSPIPDTKPTSDKLFKISLIIISLLIALGLFGNIYLLTKKQKVTDLYTERSRSATPIQTIATPTINVTANWKSYTNDFAGFSLKYPEDFIFTEKSPSIKEKQVIFTGNAGELTIDMATLDISPGWGGGCDEKDSYQFTFIGKARSICLTQSSLHQLYETNPGKSQINISATFNLPYEENKEAIFQILSTFKFLDQVSVDQTASWKTYNNSTYRFSFKYPDNVIANELNSKYINLSRSGVVMPILIYENPEGLSRRQFFAKSNNSTIEELGPYLNIKEVQVGNKTALRIVQSGDYFQQQSIPYTHYLIAIGNNIMYITTNEYHGELSEGNLTLVPDTDNSTIELIKQILSTFKFLP